MGGGLGFLFIPMALMGYMKTIKVTDDAVLRDAREGLNIRQVRWRMAAMYLALTVLG